MTTVSYYLRIIAAYVILYSLNFNVIIASAYSVDFFDVGQGHCFIARTKNNGVVIVDAGSSSTVGVDGLDEETDKYDQLAQNIFNSIKEDITTSKKLNFIITHADKDHLNLAVPITTRVQSELKKKKISIRFILGGRKGDYNKKDASTLVEFLENEEIPHTYGASFKLSKNLLTWDPPQEFAFDSDNEGIKFLSVKNDIKPSKPLKEETKRNASSIVVKITLGEWSVMITGDKTKSEIALIIGKYKQAKQKKELISDVLLATHHGSEEDFCALWMEKVKPYILVLSAGQSSFFHPRYEATCSAQVLKNLRFLEGGLNWHPIRSFGILSDYENHPDKLVPICAGNADNFRNASYSYCMTNTGIYSTADQGTINLIFDGRHGTVNPSRQKGSKNLEIATNRFLASKADNWLRLVVHRPFSLPSLESDIINHCTGLKELNLKHYKAKDEDASSIVKIVSALKSLSALDLSSSILTPQNKKSICEAWGQRGLTFS